MPAYDPCGPEREGFADIEIGRDYLEFTLAGGAKVRLPGITIEREGIRVVPGGDNDVNRIHLCLLVGKISCTEDADWVEVVPSASKRMQSPHA